MPFDGNYKGFGPDTDTFTAAARDFAAGFLHYDLACGEIQGLKINSQNPDARPDAT